MRGARMNTPSERQVVPFECDVRLEAPHLTPVRVSVDDDIGESEVIPVEHDHARARPEHRSIELPDRLVEPVEPGELHDGRRLTAGDHDPVEPVELLRKPHLDDVGTEKLERARVLAEGTLEGEHSDARSSRHRARLRDGRHQPRTSSRSSSGSELAEIPTIGWPSPVDTSASTLGSSKCVVASTIARARRVTSSTQPS